jgi:ribosomal protein L1
MIATKKQRKFVETIELQIGLRDYDPEKTNDSKDPSSSQTNLILE